MLGLALNSPGDTVEAELTAKPGVEIVEITGDGGLLSRDADKNVIGRAASAVLQRAGPNGVPPSGVRLWLHKQMPLASGLGSSGASSAAAALAVNELLERPLGQNDILLSAIEGETAASGTPHADNVAPSLLGGFKNNPPGGRQGGPPGGGGGTGGGGPGGPGGPAGGGGPGGPRPGGGGPNRMGNTLFRATRYASNHPAFEGKTLKPGKTLVEIQEERESNGR